MTTLEEQLKSDATGHYRLKLIDQLNNEAMTVNRILNRGCRPDEYQRQEALKNALDAAERIIQRVAAQVQGNSGF